MKMIGLKYNLKRNGRGLRAWLSSICYEIRYAWQRAWIGHDDVDVIDTQSRFQERMVPILKDFKEHNVGLLWISEGQEKFINQGYIDEADKCTTYSEEEGDCILDVMIHHLEMMDEDYVCKTLYGEKWYELDDIDMDEIWKIQEQNKRLFFQLFETFYYQLWY